MVDGTAIGCRWGVMEKYRLGFLEPVLPGCDRGGFAVFMHQKALHTETLILSLTKTGAREAQCCQHELRRCEIGFGYGRVGAGRSTLHDLDHQKWCCCNHNNGGVTISMPNAAVNHI